LDTNSRLADRVDQIRVLKDLLERTAAALEREIGSLNDAKQNLEYALDQRVGLATHVTVDNLVSREGRRDGDIVEDVVDVELHKVAYCGGGVAPWLGSRVVSVLDSGTEGPGVQIPQSRRCRVTVLGKLFTPIVLLFANQQNW